MDAYYVSSLITIQIGAVIIPILQKRKLRLTEFQWVAQGHTLSRATIPFSDCLTQSPGHLPLCSAVSGVTEGRSFLPGMNRNLEVEARRKRLSQTPPTYECWPVSPPPHGTLGKFWIVVPCEQGGRGQLTKISILQKPHLQAYVHAGQPTETGPQTLIVLLLCPMCVPRVTLV
jgi:hypothetical protein